MDRRDTNKTTIDNYTLASFVGITILAGTILAIPSVLADTEAVDTVTITVPSACSLQSTVGSAHIATVDSGTYVDDIGETTLKAVCNDSDGFSIYAVGYTDDTYGNTVLRSSLGTTSNVVTGIASSGSTSNWAMKLTAIENTYTPTIQSDSNGSFADFHIIPSTYTKVAIRNSTTDATVGSTLTTTYAVFMNATQPAGTYEGKVKYTLVHPASEPPLQPQTTASGRICYYPNGNDVIGTMGCQTVSSSATSTTLLASNFSRYGYGFAGWSDVFDYSTNIKAHFYGPNETIAFAAGQYTGPNDGLSLYAVWVKSTGSLQDTNVINSLCGTGTSGLTRAITSTTPTLTSVAALTDERDEETYAIAKLADGNCWMIENLRLEHDATVGNNAIDPTKTNASLSQGYNVNFIGLSSAEDPSLFSNNTTANDLYTTESNVIGKITISGSNPGFKFPRYNNVNTPTLASDRPQNPTTNDSTNTTSNASMFSYGNYYTWHAVIADTSFYSSGDRNNTSICPRGWRVPTGGDATKEFGLLDLAIGGSGADQFSSVVSNGWRKYPSNFVYSGDVLSGWTDSRGTIGYYWSSTPNNSDGAYHVFLGNSTIKPGTGGMSKTVGFTVRCIASPNV